MNNNYCGCKNENECNSCIKNILEVICMIQENACPGCGSIDSCDRPTLGIGPSCLNCNTRPICLYSCCSNGTAWSMPTSREETSTTTSTVFRVEKINGCCCTFRVLAPNPDTTSPYPYVTTDSVFTIDINCISAVRCLNDTYVEGAC